MVGNRERKTLNNITKAVLKPHYLFQLLRCNLSLTTYLSCVKFSYVQASRFAQGKIVLKVLVT